MTTPPSASSSTRTPARLIPTLVAQSAKASGLLGVDFVPIAVAPSGKPTGGASTPAAAPPPIARSTRDRAAHQAKLDAVRARYEHDAPHAKFGFTFTNLVWGEGDPAARLMFIGEAPGADEDRTGRPFVGRAGKLLDNMIVAMGMAREDVYIANVLKVRPPGNATPTPAERDASKAYLFDQIDAVRPEVIVTLGLPASQTVLDCDLAMGKMRGVWAEFVHPNAKLGLKVAVMPTYHPAYLLRSYTPENRKLVWSDLKKVVERLR
ncbi:MAG: uracil-DNA glycosylase [Phycisphaerales bacterium]|nr:uracil-DNA glycosylase [Phycisphaerales bacterium]